MKTISAYGARVAPYLTLLALEKTGLQWAMHGAQHLSLENLALELAAEVTFTTTADVQKFKVQAAPNTLCGIPYTIDNTLDPGWIELRLGDLVLIRIESLAIPAGMN